MKVVYIHGASATGDSFNYIREHLKCKNEHIIEYSSKNGFENNLAEMKRELEGDDFLFFVSHSLGGIYSLHLANHFTNRTLGGVSISTPYGGCKEADYAKYFLPFSQLLRDVGVNSKPITETRSLKISYPWCNIVTIRGESLWISEPNDGVVTIASMKSRQDIELVELPHNHYEVVICQDVVDVIKARLPK